MPLLLRVNQLRNIIWSSCPVMLQMQHAGLPSGKLLGPRSYEKRHFTTRVQTLETAVMDTTTTGLGSCNSGIQQLKLQRTSEHGQSATILVFDIETTGFLDKSNNNRIVELALRDLSGGKNSTFETLINPEMDIPTFVEKVHKISTKMVRRHDIPRFGDVLPLLLAFVQSRQTPGKPVIWVAHRAKAFDAPFLAREFDRCSVQMPTDWLFVDSVCLARKLPNMPKSSDGKKHLVNLEALRKHYGIRMEGSAHRAMQDVTTLCQVFQKITFDLNLSYEGLMNDATKSSAFSKVS